MELEKYIVIAKGNRVAVRVPRTPAEAMVFAFGNVLIGQLDDSSCEDGTVYKIESCGSDQNGDPVLIGTAVFFQLKDNKVVELKDQQSAYKQFLEQENALL